MVREGRLFECSRCRMSRNADTALSCPVCSIALAEARADELVRQDRARTPNVGASEREETANGDHPLSLNDSR